MDDEFFRVESPCSVIYFRLSEIVGLEKPNWPKKPAGWAGEKDQSGTVSGVAAIVYVRNRSDVIALTQEQWMDLREKLELWT